MSGAELGEGRTSSVRPIVVPPLGHHGPAAALAAVATLALVLTPREFGPTGVLVTVVVMQVGLIGAWSRATGTRGYVGSLLIGAAGAVASDSVLALQAQPDLGPLAAALALAFLAALVHQMSRSAPRRLATASLAGVSLLVVTLIALSILLLLYRVTDGSDVYVAIVAASGGAVVVGHLVDLVLPIPRITPDVPRGLTALVLSVAVGIAATVMLSDAHDLTERLGAAMVGAILGLVSALLAIAASYIAAERRRLHWSLPWLQAVIPLAGATPVGYFLALQILS